jgi:hypothetical protein
MGPLGVSLIANFLNDFWRASILTLIVADLPFLIYTTCISDPESRMSLTVTFCHSDSFQKEV